MEDWLEAANKDRADHGLQNKVHLPINDFNILTIICMTLGDTHPKLQILITYYPPRKNRDNLSGRQYRTTRLLSAKPGASGHQIILLFQQLAGYIK